MKTRAGLPLAGLLIVVGAGLAALAASRTWFTAVIPDTPAGPVVNVATGNDLLPELTPVAVVAIAGFGAVLATRGFWRRAVGALIVLAGLLIAVRSVVAIGHPPLAVLGRTPFVVNAPVQPIGHPVPAILAAVAGVLIAAGGTLPALGAGAARGMGSRFSAPGVGGRPPGAVLSEPSGAEPDPAELWRRLDSGDDPTAERDRPDPLGDDGSDRGRDPKSDHSSDPMAGPAARSDGAPPGS